MKKLLYLCLFVWLIQSCSSQDSTANEKVANDEQIALVSIEGMTCAMGCAKAIESNLVDLEGIENAKVDFESKLATIEYSKKNVDKAEIISAITNTNGGGIYEVTSFELEELVKESAKEIKEDQKEVENEETTKISVSDPSKILYEFPSIFTALLKLR